MDSLSVDLRFYDTEVIFARLLRKMETMRVCRQSARAHTLAGLDIQFRSPSSICSWRTPFEGNVSSQ